MFHRQRDLGCDVDFPSMPEPARGESLGEFARRIDVSEGPRIFAGASMGGMVALELARIRPCRGVFLIASSRSSKMVAPMFKALSPVLNLAPGTRGARLPAWTLFVARMGPLPDSDRTLLADALHGHPIDRLREYVRMILEWEGVADPGVPVFHLHGARDEIIPLRFVKPDVVVRSAGHAVNLSHADDVNAHLRRFIVARESARS